MTDPFYMMMLMQNLGRDFVVWDKAAAIRFKRPGKGRVRAEFRLSQEDLDGIRKSLETERKVEPVYLVKVVAEEGVVVAEVDKTLYVRLKEPR